MTIIKKIDINNRYIQSEEIRHNILPYLAFYDCIKNTFDLSKIQSFCDVGCANGNLLYLFNQEFPKISICGLEYFSWQKDASHDSIKNNIIIHDLRDPFLNNEKFDIVNCTEVGEHIDKEFVNIFINNLKKLCGKYLILSWSDSGGENDLAHDSHCQHLNPMPIEEVFSLISSNGFILDEELTNKFINLSISQQHFHFWWRKSLGIWKLN